VPYAVTLDGRFRLSRWLGDKPNSNQEHSSVSVPGASDFTINPTNGDPPRWFRAEIRSVRNIQNGPVGPILNQRISSERIVASLEQSRWWSEVTRVTDWLVRLLWASSLWALAVLAGAGILGIGPATGALASLTRKWAQGQTDVRPWPVFWHTFHDDWWRTTRLAWIMVGVIGLLTWEIHLATSPTLHGLHAIVIPLGLLDAMVVAISLYVFPLYAHRHFDRLGQYFRLAAVTSLLNPGRTVLLLALLYGFIFVLGGILRVIAVSALMYAMVRLSLAGFSRLEQMSLTPGKSSPPPDLPP